VNHTVTVYGIDQTPQSLVLDLAGVETRRLSPRAFAVGIRVLFQNWRQGTVASKTRGQLAFSNKKPWKQKGTGRARVSSIRSPLWRKGGIIFGPQPRTRMLSVNAGQKRLVLNNLLQRMITQDSVLCLDMDMLPKPSTKTAQKFINAADLTHKKVLMFLSPGDDVIFSSFINIPNIKIIFFDQPNAYDLASAQTWVILKRDVALFKEMVLRWN
jgi:large subunit ribosomal protein L4